MQELSDPSRSMIPRVMAMLGCGCLLYFLANVQRVAIPGAVFDQLQQELGVSASGVTAFGAIFMYVYAAAQLLIGFTISRYGSVRTLFAGCVFFCGGTLLFAGTKNLPLLYLARAATGLGAAAFYLSVVNLLLKRFHENSNLAISVFVMVGYAGAVFAAAPFSAAVEAWGLRTILAAVAVLSLAAAVCFCFFAAGVPKQPIHSGSLQLQSFLEPLYCRHNRSIFIFGGLNWGVYYVIQTVIGKKFLEDYCLYSRSSAAWIMSITGALAALFGFLWALLSKFSGNRRRWVCRIAGIMVLTVTGLACIALLANWHSPLLGGLFCLISVTASISAIVIPLLNETNPPRISTFAVAELNFFFYAAVAVFGNLAGFLMGLFPPERRGEVLCYGRNSYLCVFLLLFCCAVPAFLASRRIRETNGKVCRCPAKFANGINGCRE